jgi:DNA repair exonuclease SbcCD nuclease subunit
MIKKIIQISDLHVRKNTNRYEEYKEQFDKFLNQAKEICENYSYGEVRTVICGDIFHDKIITSNEQKVFISNFLKELDKFCVTIVYSGNHDILESNFDRMGSIYPLFNMINFKNTFYIDLINDYKSGFFVDDNIVWVLYSIFDNFKRPNIEEMRLEEKNKNKIFAGLFHGPIVGSSSDMGFQMENGISPEIFNGCDVVLAGDIHKYQTIKYNNIDIVYPSSLIQQNYGENVSGHGYVVWDINGNKITHTHHQIESDYGFYKFKISSVEDIENSREKIINL